MGTKSASAAIYLVREATTRGPSMVAAWTAPSHWRTRPAYWQGEHLMRTLRLSLVGTVTLALLGGAGSMVAAQEAPGGVYVTSSSECAEVWRTVQEDDAVELHRFRLECTLTSSDPRLSGSGVVDVQQFCLKEDAGHVCMGWGTTDFAGPDGTWVGTMGYVQEPSGMLPGWGVTEGTGAYEGWTYWYHQPDLMEYPTPEYGILYQGPPPPWGETLPLTPAE